MKKTLFDYQKQIVIFFAFYLPLMFVCLFQVRYTFTTPGFNDNIEGFILLEETYDQEGTFHTTSVIVIDKISIFQKFYGDFDKTVEVNPFPEFYDTLDIDDLTIMGYLSKSNSLQNSLVVGIREAGYDIEYESYYIIELVYNILEEGTLELGDRIVSINGSTDIVEAIGDVACNESVVFDVLRDDVPMTFRIKRKDISNDPDNPDCLFGIRLNRYTEIISSEITYTLVETNTGGSSGGLLQALYIYNQITEFDITRGLKIAGTGTLSVEGKVGPIGGVQQKILTSHYNNIDIFFVPHFTSKEGDNYIDALKVYNTLNTKMVLVPVTTFQDALDYLLDGDNFD